jgi:tight adherence protein B
VTGLLLGLVFATGVALVWLGAVAGITLPSPASGQAWPALVRGARTGLVLVVPAVAASLVTLDVVGVPILGLSAGVAAGYAPAVVRRRRREAARVERERAWPAALAQLADALEAGIAFPAAVALVAHAGPPPLRPELAGFHARLRAAGLEAALDGLVGADERSADTVALLLRAGLLELPAGGLAPVLRELSTVLNERFEAREKARSRASSLRLEAAILALSPILLLGLVGLASPAYLDAYRTAQGTVVAAVGAALIFGCYLMMRRLGRVPEPRRTQHARPR